MRVTSKSILMGVMILIAGGMAFAQPSVVSTLPTSGTGSFQNFAVTVADASGPSNIATVYFVVNATLSVTNSCVASYSHVANALFLLNDAGDSYQGPIIPGTSGSLANSQCTLSAAGASISTSGTTLTVNIPLTFTAFHGAKSTFGLVGDNSSVYSPWTTTGAWTIS